MRRTWLLATLLGLATVALRLPRAFGDALWQDEVASARILREPTLGGMLHHVVRTESTPPLWYALGWIMHRGGIPLHEVRLLSVVAGALLVVLTVRLVSEIAPLPVAATAGVLLMLGAQFTAHGRELRAYALFALLTIAFAITLHRAASTPTRGRLVAVGVVTAAGAMTHYFFAFTLAGGLAWLWFEPAARSARRRVSTAILVALAACCPWLPLFLAQYRHDRYSWIGPFDPRETIETPLRIFAPLVATPVAGAAFLVWLLVGGWIAARRGPLERLLATLAVAPLLLAGVTWAAGVDIFAVRNMIGIGPFVAVVVLLPLTAAPVAGRVRTAGALAITASAAALFVAGQTPSPPYNAIAAALVREGWRPADSVVVHGSFFAYRSPLEWYLPNLPTLVRGRQNELGRRPTFAVLDHRSLPRRVIMSAEKVGPYVVARVRPRAATRWLRHGIVLTTPPTKVPAFSADPGGQAHGLAHTRVTPARDPFDAMARSGPRFR